jgi:hypothetical protein
VTEVPFASRRTRSPSYALRIERWWHFRYRGTLLLSSGEQRAERRLHTRVSEGGIQGYLIYKKTQPSRTLP